MFTIIYIDVDARANFRLPFCLLLLYYIKEAGTVSAHKSGAIECLYWQLIADC